MSRVYSIKRKQKIPIGLNAAWNFFCKPHNLKQMVPANIHFSVATPLESSVIYPGQIIKYKMDTRFGFSLPWVTEITEVEEKQYFIDEQQSGPFKLWRHQHYFVEIPGGIEMTDILHYKTRLGFVGDVLHVLFLRRRVKQIFNYRSKQLVHLFGEYVDREQVHQ
jgi:ligand-binding SRPBCC domain-containing protein